MFITTNKLNLLCENFIVTEHYRYSTEYNRFSITYDLIEREMSKRGRSDLLTIAEKEKAKREAELVIADINKVSIITYDDYRK